MQVNQLIKSSSFNTDGSNPSAQLVGLLENCISHAEKSSVPIQEAVCDQFSFDIVPGPLVVLCEEAVQPASYADDNQSIGAMQIKTTTATAAIVKFIVDRATKSAIEAVLTCAMDNSPYWKDFFEQGLADAIAEENAYEYMFFEKLCGGIGLPYSADIIDGYLSTLPSHHLERFLSESLKRKSHPASKAFISATCDTVEGRHFLRIVEVFFKHGMCMDPIGSRLVVDLERAVCDGNKAFMSVVIPKFSVVPSSLLCTVMAKAQDPALIVNMLMEICAIPLEAFTDPKILAEAQPRARDYVAGLIARRAEREPERIIERKDDDCILNEVTA